MMISPYDFSPVGTDPRNPSRAEETETVYDERTVFVTVAARAVFLLDENGDPADPRGEMAADLPGIIKSGRYEITEVEVTDF